MCSNQSPGSEPIWKSAVLQFLAGGAHLQYLSPNLKRWFLGFAAARLIWQRLSFNHKLLLESFAILFSSLSFSCSFLFNSSARPRWIYPTKTPDMSTPEVGASLEGFPTVSQAWLSHPCHPPSLLFQLLADLYHRARAPLFFSPLFSCPLVCSLPPSSLFLSAAVKSG